jgi:hypothetical protein
LFFGDFRRVSTLLVPQCPSHLLLKEKEPTFEVVSSNTQQPTTKSTLLVPQCPSHFLCEEKEPTVEVVSVNTEQPTTKSEAPQQPKTTTRKTCKIKSMREQVAAPCSERSNSHKQSEMTV